MNEQIPSGRIPSGWYPDPNPGAAAGQQRYWNGSAWTKHTTAPATGPTTVQPTVAEPAVSEPAGKSGVYSRWGLPVLVGVVSLLVGVALGGAGGSSAEELEAGRTGEPTPAPTVTVDPTAAREADLDQLAADLEKVAAEQATVSEELAAKEAELAAREQAVSAAEQEQAVEPEPPAAAPEPADECHQSYEPCVPITSDVDCAGGSGNGPAYTGRVRVIGPDEYGLDDNGDGVGCEAS